MKKVSLLVVILVVLSLLFFLFLRFAKEKIRDDLSQSIAYPSVTPTPKVKVDKSGKIVTSLFVPYWTLKDGIQEERSYDVYIYFGISPGNDGLNKEEVGAKNIETFLEAVPSGGKKLLTLRMIDNQSNFAILKNIKKQEQIISQSVSLARKHGFDGIVLDLEITAIPFDSLVQQVNAFTKLFYKETTTKGLSLSLALYGDTFYRIRPFDVKALSDNADMIYIMAYDFHKSKGNPGPNFPLAGKQVYGYDITTMTEDFLKFVPPQKLSVIFGLFGYDWTVDEKVKSIKNAKPLTYTEIKKNFLIECSYKNCSIRRDKNSSETEIRYEDDNAKSHSVWFEDRESVLEKQKYLKKRGISAFSFWANGYFE